MSDHILATKHGIMLVADLLLYTGALCHECGYGTRVKSKKWSECKRCGAKVERRKTEDFKAELLERNTRKGDDHE